MWIDLCAKLLSFQCMGEIVQSKAFEYNGLVVSTLCFWAGHMLIGYRRHTRKHAYTTTISCLDPIKKFLPSEWGNLGTPTCKTLLAVSLYRTIRGGMNSMRAMGELYNTAPGYLKSSLRYWCATKELSSCEGISYSLINLNYSTFCQSITYKDRNVPPTRLEFWSRNQIYSN